MQTDSPQDLTRHRLPLPTATGHRKGFHRLITQVLDGTTNTQAFQGDYLPADQETDLAPGAVIVRKTPTNSIRNSAVIWHYAHVPQEGLPWQWQGPFEDADFLSFRDTVHHALQAWSQTTLEQPPPFLQNIPVHTPTPGDIQTGAQFRQALETILQQPDVQDVVYDHQRLRLVPHTADGPDHSAHHQLLTPPSTFIEHILSRIPFFMVRSFRWKGLEGNVAADEDAIFQHYFGMSRQYARFLLTPNPQPPDMVVINLMRKAAAAAEARIPAYSSQIWTAISQNLKTIDLTLHLTSDPKERRILLPRLVYHTTTPQAQ